VVAVGEGGALPNGAVSRAAVHRLPSRSGRASSRSYSAERRRRPAGVAAIARLVRAMGRVWRFLNRCPEFVNHPTFEPICGDWLFRKIRIRHGPNDFVCFADGWTLLSLRRPFLPSCCAFISRYEGPNPPLRKIHGPTVGPDERFFWGRAVVFAESVCIRRYEGQLVTRPEPVATW
jgi:hypothetical protein